MTSSFGFDYGNAYSFSNTPTKGNGPPNTSFRSGDLFTVEEDPNNSPFINGLRTALRGSDTTSYTSPTGPGRTIGVG